jgi:1-aminocyclopropane-1-carboxylate deaminase/D-cysteine desulfhydrase-like pyridoxal-dependent ACC family enzyme
VLAIGVAKGVNLGLPDVAELAGETLALIARPPTLVTDQDVCIDSGWLGEDYAIPTEEGDAAIRWAARHGGWVLDRVYSGKGMAGMLGNAAAGRWPPGSDVIFVHTGGMPAIFTPGGVAASALA